MWRRGCHRRDRLEAHHLVEYADSKHTLLDELVYLCAGNGSDHDLVTHHGHTLRKCPDGQYDRIPPDHAHSTGDRAPPERAA